ncbi:FadR/GntR family transcriptional regulator [Arthrobacter sp. 35W]|uniref:FadR/GntR family transcriptional regulator n=1 Tax=Arthrobacter sp. 35W TaxID=1132441 RepID=UPI0004106D5A|nr:FCD domain-containing protein [Arthrobacter sp. 35W]
MNSDPVQRRERVAMATMPAKVHSRHNRFVEMMGQQITAGELPEGEVLKSEELEERFASSRSVVREGLRVLETLGMVASRRNVGVSILGSSSWNVFDPQLIRWRLAGANRQAQLQSLTQLRSAVEPLAAGLAARAISVADGRRLMKIAGELVATGNAGDLEAFLALDIEFHSLILQASGNEMLSHLDSAVAEVLAGRTHHGLMPDKPRQEARHLHYVVADAIQRGMAAEAEAAMRGIVTQAGDEMATAMVGSAEPGGAPGA